MYITTSTEKRIQYSVTMHTIQYGLVNSAMGQIRCSTERIFCIYHNFVSKWHMLIFCNRIWCDRCQYCLIAITLHHLMLVNHSNLTHVFTSHCLTVWHFLTQSWCQKFMQSYSGCTSQHLLSHFWSAACP